MKILFAFALRPQLRRRTAAAAADRRNRRSPHVRPTETAGRARRLRVLSPAVCRRTRVRQRRRVRDQFFSREVVMRAANASLLPYTALVRSKIGGGPAVLPPSPLTTYQPACKPGSVWPAARAADVTAIPLARRLPGASSNLPERLIRTDLGLLPRRSYSVLLPVGFAVPLPLPETRCALTAPFHPCRG